MTVSAPRARMTVRSAVIVGVALGSLLALVPTVSAQRPRGQGQGLLEQARRAIAAYDFTGVVVVEWQDRGVRRRETVPVTDSAGMLEVGEGRRMMGAGPSRLVDGADGWHVLWSDTAPETPPSAEVKYDLTVRRGTVVADRPTTVVEASRSGAAGVRDRLFVDDETGLLLRREQLDRRGRVVRAVGFESISDPVVAGPEESQRASHALPRPEQPAHRRAPHSLAQLAAPYRAPARVGDRYELVGRYRDPDGTVQLFYSDGLFDVSVFEQTGALDTTALPDGGRWVAFGGHRARVYDTPTGAAVIWEGAGVVYTCVTDAPAGEVEAMLGDFPRRSSPGGLQRVVDTLLGPFSWS